MAMDETTQTSLRQLILAAVPDDGSTIGNYEEPEMVVDEALSPGPSPASGRGEKTLAACQHPRAYRARRPEMAGAELL